MTREHDSGDTSAERSSAESSLARSASDDLLDELEHAVLVFHGEPWRLKYANRCAVRWLSSLAEKSGQAVISPGLLFQELFPVDLSPNCQEKRLRSKLSRGRLASFELLCPLSPPERSSPAPHEQSVTFQLRALSEGRVLLEGKDSNAVRETQLILESYSALIEKKNKQIEKEQRRISRLLLNILPEKSIRQLRQFGRTIPERFPEVSVLFLDFVGFTELSQRLDTEELFSELNDIFTAFDEIIARYSCERIKTIGDAYLAVCGMPDANPLHGKLIVCAAIEMRDYIRARNERSEYQWRCRVGIHSGEVTGGVVGRLKYIYDIFGDGVNTASRMESMSEPMKINISAETRRHLDERYQLTARGRLTVKGKGELEMFFVDGVKGPLCGAMRREDLPLLKVQDTLDESLSGFTYIERD